MRVAGLLAHALCHFVVETEVEDGIHHARHGSARTGTYRYEERVVDIAELGSHQFLNVLDSSVDLILEELHDFFLSDFIILVTGICSDCESRRDWYADEVHLSQVGTLATKLLTHLRIAFSLAVAEGINSFFAHCACRFLFE